MPSVDFAAEPLHVEQLWRQFTQGHRFSPNLWNDAYLAAFAILSGLNLVTFDGGFSQFPGLTYTVLK